MTAVVDVVLATNRASPFLAQALDSLSRQSFLDWKLWLVDDGSPDPAFLERAVAGIGSVEIRRTTPAGLAAARNTGIAAGRAPFIAFLDDDDEWEIDRLSAQVDALVECPDAVASYTAGRYIDEHGQDSGSGWSEPAAPAREYLSGAAVTPRIVTLMVRRSAAKDVGHFDTTLRVTEDNDYILRLAQLGEFVGVDRPLVRYRRHGSNASQANALRARQETRRALTRQAEKARAVGREDVADQLHQNLTRLRGRWAEESMSSLTQAVRARDVKSVASELMWAVKRHPLHTGWVLLKRLRRQLGLGG